jgi:hypothetical protein
MHNVDVGSGRCMPFAISIDSLLYLLAGYSVLHLSSVLTDVRHSNPHLA